MRLTRTVAPTGWCATPGSSGMPLCRSVSLYLSFTNSHHCSQGDVGSGLNSKNEYFRAPYLPKYLCFNMLTTVLRPTFSQASLQLDQETGTITVTDNRYFDRETKESESNDKMIGPMIIFLIIFSLHHDD